MEVETKAGWITAVRQLGQAIEETGGDGGEVTSNDITDATDVGKSVLTASTQEAARDVIGAGTSNLTIGTTASTAKAGDYSPPLVTESDDGLMLAADKVKLNGIAEGATALTIGTTADTAKAGNYAPTTDEITDATDVGKSVLTADTAAAARTAIGAGTSNLAIGTTASTAKAGNYTPSTAEVSTSLKAKDEIAALTEIATPAEATTEDVAVAVNAIIAALKA